MFRSKMHFEHHLPNNFFIQLKLLNVYGANVNCNASIEIQREKMFY